MKIVKILISLAAINVAGLGLWILAYGIIARQYWLFKWTWLFLYIGELFVFPLAGLGLYAALERISKKC